jgi:hypothetical protein
MIWVVIQIVGVKKKKNMQTVGVVLSRRYQGTLSATLSSANLLIHHL